MAMRRVGHAGLVCAVAMITLLVPHTDPSAVISGGESVIAPVAAATAPAQRPDAVSTGARFVTYNGVRVTVPATWPVIDLRVHPQTCVRFDKAAVYLGSPGSQSACPAHAVGRVNTVWLRTASAGQEDPMTPHEARVGALAARLGVNPTGHDKQAQFVAQAVDLTATWGADSSSIDQVLASAVASSSPSKPAAAPLPPAATATSATAVTATQPVSYATRPVSYAAATSASVASSTFTGMAFDTCAAPSATTMSSWLASPYRSAGIYIGGSMRACPDGNLSAAWVAQVRAMGWGLLPLYVGVQAPCVNQPGLGTIPPSRAAATGTSDAVDAVSRAKLFGLNSGTPIYYDMESYNTSVAGCSNTVLTFISAWTAELHHLGYKAGAYGNTSSLMVDMSRSVGFVLPDDVWFASWNQLQTSSDSATYPSFPDADWSHHQRLHQYSGSLSQSWGGAALNIDANWVDASVAGAAVPVSYGTNVVGPGGSGFVFTGSMTYWRSGAPVGLKKLAYWTYSNGSTEANGATWSPQLAPGRYDVEANIPTTNATANAPYTIKNALGTTRKVVNQRTTKGYTTLGTFTARAGSSISVHVGDNDPSSTAKQIGVDAMAFRLVARAPSSPTTVSATGGNARVAISWTAAVANGSPVTGYTVTASPGGAKDSVNGSTTSTVMSGLTNGTRYTFTVTATNAAGTSPASTPSAGVTPRVPSTSSAPTGATAAPGDAQAVASWTAPASNGGAFITGYTVTASPGGNTVTTTGATIATVTGLTDGTPYTFTVTATNSVGIGPASAPTAAVTPTSGGDRYTALNPTRVMDTHTGLGAPKAKVGPGAQVTLTIPGLPTGTTAVALNVTATNATATSYLTLYPNGQTRPTDSNLNFTAGQTIPNMVIARVGAGNKVTFFNAAGTVDILADLTGYYAPGAGAGYAALTPKRVMDTHTGLGAPKAKVGPGAQVTVTIPGLPTGTTAVALNVTATNATATSYLTLYPSGRTRPPTSNLNFTAGRTIPNMVIARVGAGNKVTFYNAAGTVDILTDLAGYYAPGAGAGYIALTPTRVMDTRTGLGIPKAKVGPGAQVTVTIPGLPAGTTAVALHVTATNPTATSYLTLYPSGQTRPPTSNLNFVKGQTIPNLVIAGVRAGNKVTFYNAAGTVDILTDVDGCYAP
jgi:Domain of unknown function (DUF1906)/Fibronectin type III domain